MKDLVIYEKQSKQILAIITDYKETKNKPVILNQLIDVYLVDSNKHYLVNDLSTGILKFVNPDNKVLYMKDYR